MKIGLILPANLNHAPYVKHYQDIFEKNSIDYEIIEFDKIGLNQTKNNIISYKYICDYSSHFIKKILSYIKFKKFCEREIELKKYNFIIIFVPQFAILMLPFLLKNYKEKYFIDIRDYNKIFKFKFLIKNLLKYSKMNVISSEGFKEWLPNGEYYLNNNLELSFLEKTKIKEKNKTDIKKILNCGVIRSFDENMYLIKQLKNSQKLTLEYRGESKIANLLNLYVVEEKIKNVIFKAGYLKKEEFEFYLEADMINIMQTRDYLSKYAMPNRFYTALLAKKPILAIDENLVGKLVKEYELGVVLPIDLDENKLEDKIINYLESYDKKKFENTCDELLKKYLAEEKIFEERLVKIVKDR